MLENVDTYDMLGNLWILYFYTETNEFTKIAIKLLVIGRYATKKSMKITEDPCNN